MAAQISQLSKSKLKVLHRVSNTFMIFILARACEELARRRAAEEGRLGTHGFWPSGDPLDDTI